MTETSKKHKGGNECFYRLFKSFEDELFFPNLLTFLVKRDISDFVPRKMLMTSIKREVLIASKTSYRLFIEEYINEFTNEKGFNCSAAYESFKSFCLSNGFVSCASNKLDININPYVDRKRVWVDGKLESYHFIKPGFKLDDEDYNEVIDVDLKVDVHIWIKSFVSKWISILSFLSMIYFCVHSQDEYNNSQPLVWPPYFPFQLINLSFVPCSWLMFLTQIFINCGFTDDQLLTLRIETSILFGLTLLILKLWIRRTRKLSQNLLSRNLRGTWNIRWMIISKWT